jgi:hypothetical protein
VPRLSLWRERHSNDYRFIDRRISEEFTIGGTGVYLHKYLGANNAPASYTLTTTANIATANQQLSINANVRAAGISIGQRVTGPGIAANTTVTAVNSLTNVITISNSLTNTINSTQPVNIYWHHAEKPQHLNTSEQNIQDLLFLENRDRKYDSSVYTLRGIYQVSDNDFDLKQFGIFLSTDTVLMTFHLNDVIATLGRKIMAGDVLELPHLVDYYPLDTDIPIALRRYYVVQEVVFAAEGFSMTWWPHLIRVKLTPLVDSQEYKDIIDKISDGEDRPVGSYLTTYDKLLRINDAIIEKSEIDVPASGYDTSGLYTRSIRDSGVAGLGDPVGGNAGDSVSPVNNSMTADTGRVLPQQGLRPYIGGSGIPNGISVIQSTSFPAVPTTDSYVLRTDYSPNRLFRYDGRRWVKVEDILRTPLTKNDPDNLTQRESFVKEEYPNKQSLSRGLTPKADN